MRQASSPTLACTASQIGLTRREDLLPFIYMNIRRRVTNVLPNAHGISRRLSLVFIAAALAAGFPGLSAANPAAQGTSPDRPIYQYTDQHGGLTFTDDLSRIPAQARSTVKTVALPSLTKVPDPSPQPQPQPEATSLIARIHAWSAGLSPTSRFILAAILPTAVVLLAGLSYLRRRTDSDSVRFALRFGMVAIVLLSLSVTYLVVMRAHAATPVDGVLHGDDDVMTSLRREGAELNRRVINLIHPSDNIDDGDDQSSTSP